MVQWHLPVILWLLICASLSSLHAQPSAPAQKPPYRDIRTQTEYYGDHKRLKQKAQTYYDFWSEREVRHGRFSEWRRNGALRYEAWYTEGKLHGTATWYNRREKPVKTAIYENGTLVPVAKPAPQPAPSKKPEQKKSVHPETPAEAPATTPPNPQSP